MASYIRTVSAAALAAALGGGAAGASLSSLMLASDGSLISRIHLVSGTDKEFLIAGSGLPLGGGSGSFIGLYGNTHTTGLGRIQLKGGSLATGHVEVFPGPSASFKIRDASNNDRFTVDYDGKVTLRGADDSHRLIRLEVTDGRLSLSGGAGISVANGALFQLFGGTHATNAGLFSLNGGSQATGHITLYTSHASADIQFGINGAEVLRIDTSGRLKTVAGNQTTGAGAALLGANSPAGTLSAPNTWLRFTKSDGTALYIPAWA